MTNWVGSSARPWMADRSSLLTRDGKASSRHLGVRRSTRVLTPFQACQSISSHCSPIIDRSTNVSTGAVVQRPRSDAGNQLSGQLRRRPEVWVVPVVCECHPRHIRLDCPWRDREHADPMAASFRCQCLGEAIDGGLAGRPEQMRMRKPRDSTSRRMRCRAIACPRPRRHEQFPRECGAPRRRSAPASAGSSARSGADDCSLRSGSSLARLADCWPWIGRPSASNRRT